MEPCILVNQVMSMMEVLGRLEKGIEGLTEAATINANAIAVLQRTAQDNRACINNLTDIVEDGLSDKVHAIDAYVKERQILDSAGITGFFKTGWDEFKKKLGLAIFMVIFFLLLWGIIKTMVFHEFPFWDLPKIHVTSEGVKK